MHSVEELKKIYQEKVQRDIDDAPKEKEMREALKKELVSGIKLASANGDVSEHKFTEEEAANVMYFMQDDVPESIITEHPFDSNEWMKLLDRAKKYAKAVEAAEKAKGNRKDFWRDPFLGGVRQVIGRGTRVLLEKGEVPIVSPKTGEKEVVRVDPQTVIGKTVRVDTIVPPTSAPKYAKTEVHVVNMDSLTLTRNLMEANPGQSVICINMANQYEMGGGWVKGRLAQEEMLMSRTSLSASLKTIEYPLYDFSCVASHGVTVLRKDEKEGMAFLPPEERWSFNVLTVAGFDLNQKDKTLPPKPFTNEMLIGTRIKIESMFALCANEGMDVLVLSALGCGSFKNPPVLVSAAFRAVIEQYAGYFDKIYFGIYSDPGRPNPNAIAFSKVILDRDLEEIPTAYKLADALPNSKVYECPNFEKMVSTDVNKPICIAAGECFIDDPAHFEEEAHPPRCPLDGKCTRTDNEHRRLFSHTMVKEDEENVEVEEEEESDDEFEFEDDEKEEEEEEKKEEEDN